MWGTPILLEHIYDMIEILLDDLYEDDRQEFLKKMIKMIGDELNKDNNND